MSAREVTVTTEYNPFLIKQTVEGLGLRGKVEHIIKLQDDGVLTALADLGWVPPEKARDVEDATMVRCAEYAENSSTGKSAAASIRNMPRFHGR